MAPPSMFILLSFLSALHLCRTDPLDHIGTMVEQLQMELPEDVDATQLLLESQQLRDIANELALDYLSESDGEDEIFSNIAKRDPDATSTTNSDSEYEVFVRRGVPPSVVKLTYGKRSDDKRFKNPFFFGKREDINDMDKRRYSPFMFGKRETEFPRLSEKRSSRYSPFMFGKRAAADDGEAESEQVKRRYSALFFGKRVPEVAKRLDMSKLYFGKRGHGHYSKFMFGKREDGVVLGVTAKEGDIEQNFEKKDALREDKRFKSSFYLGKRNYVGENHDNMEDLKDV